MAKHTYEELLKKYNLERKETDYERDMKAYSPKIQAGIEAAKKRNAELAKDADKHRAEYEKRQNQLLTQQKTASTAPSKLTTTTKPKSTRPTSRTPQNTVAKATTVKPHKGGAITAEVDTEKVKRETEVSNSPNITKQQSSNTKENDKTKVKQSALQKESANSKPVEKQIHKSWKKRLKAYYEGQPEWQQDIKYAAKTAVLAPLRFVGRQAEKQEKRKKGSRYGSPYQLNIKY